MKIRYSLFTALLLLLSQSNYAQKSILHYGIKAGVDNFKYASDKYEQHKNNAFGFYAGIFANYKINDEIRLQPELLYTIHNREEILRDAKADYGWGVPLSIIGDAPIKVKESMVQLPLIIQYYTSKEFHLDFGPQMNYTFDTQYELLDTGLGSNPTLLNKPEYQRFDFGFNIGLGYYFNDFIGVNTRYYQGLMKKEGDIYSGIFDLGIELRF